MPTRNGLGQIAHCLDSLRAQAAVEGEYEVIVVDDGSTDGTTECLRSLMPDYPFNLIVQEAAGPGAARNVGADAAQGSILIFLTDNVVAHRDLVSAHLYAHRHAKETIVLGKIELAVAPHADRFTHVRAAAWRQHAQFDGEDATFVAYHSGNCSLEAELFRAVGGYATDLPGSEDLEFAYRLREASARFVFCLRASVTAHGDDGWRAIADESVTRGRMAVELYRRHPPLLPYLPLGGIGAPGPRKRRLQSALFALHAPPQLLSRLGELVPGRSLGDRILDFAFTYGYWVGVRSAVDADLWKRLQSPTIILLYHAFTRPGERRSRYVVSARKFATQLRWLSRRGYNVISLGSYLAYRREHRLPPARSVVITMDDGYSDNATVAKPILDRFGFQSTIFIVSAAGPTNGWSPDEPALATRPLIALDELPRMTGTFDFGAHTRTHVRLDEVEPALARSEILDSKRDLEETLGTDVSSFAYPHGAYDASVRDAVEAAGFSGACTVHIGANHPSTDSFELRRLEIRGGYSLPRFAIALIRADTRPIFPRLAAALSRLYD